MGYEAHPNEYIRSADGGYDRKPEYRAEQEARLSAETEDEKTARLEAEAKKRATRVMRQMTPLEVEQALKKATQLVEWMQETGEA